jgi:hypothetical protein
MSAGATTPTDLVDLADGFALGADRKLGANRYLAAALLLRQALEAAVDQLWIARAPGLERCSSRAQLVSLPYYLEAGLAQDAVYCWYRLSRHCHHDEYGLPPSQTELAHLSAIVRRLARGTPKGHHPDAG